MNVLGLISQLKIIETLRLTNRNEDIQVQKPHQWLYLISAISSSASGGEPVLLHAATFQDSH
jgi:hypothetical protein